MRVRYVFIGLLAFLLVSASALASAHGRDGDDEDDHDEADELERKVEVASDDKKVSFTFKREDHGNEDKLEAGFWLDDARFGMKYETENATAESEMKLEATFEALLEYRDSDADGRYSHGDEIVSAYAIGDADDIEADGRMDWGTPTLQDVHIDNKTGKKVQVPGMFGDTGRFELRFFVFGDYVDMGGVDLRPTSVKIDIFIGDYPYEANDTALAVLLETETKSEVERDDDHDDHDDEEVATTTVFDDTTFSLVFSWLDHAEIDGTTHAVQTTLLALKEEREMDEDEVEEKVERHLAFSYPRGDEILHDPQVELRTGSVVVAKSPGPAVAIAVSGLVAAVAWARRP